MQKTPVPRGGIATAKNPKDAAASPKPVKESGNVYDDKLVEMINTTIVDRSPSVKWDDVGEWDCYAFLLVLPFQRSMWKHTYAELLQLDLMELNKLYWRWLFYQQNEGIYSLVSEDQREVTFASLVSS